MGCGSWLPVAGFGKRRQSVEVKTPQVERRPSTNLEWLSKPNVLAIADIRVVVVVSMVCGESPSGFVGRMG